MLRHRWSKFLKWIDERISDFPKGTAAYAAFGLDKPIALLMITSMSFPSSSAAGDNAVDVDAWVMEQTQSIVDGSHSAFTAFCHRYSAQLHRYCLTLVSGNEAESYELHQLLLLRIAKHPKAISNETELWRWLKRIMRTARIDMARKQQRYGKAMQLYWEHVTTTAPDPPQVERSITGLIMDELADLNEDEREVVEKKYLEGWSVRSIAEALGASEKAIESRLTRARKNLRARVSEKLNASL